ncbi:MAG TPA: alpha/beta fold hydrolase [Bacteroidales bacterium]|jgi:dienelactone hydrolase|nr:alpha/beta fold hydrolase [Bacteroidales bacterium]HOS73293.1 alpha/beta fold hydrolase [Bacteroidales bacterium]HQH25593.1 alpha/beta fold hydrolase [Bacteroidales bacterium]HQJ83463.1 alpha/beta fold hydrolase [Bacteroidales bacterium]
MRKILRHSLALFLLSGLIISLAGQIKSPAADLLVHRNRSGRIKTIRSERQWEKQRKNILENMQDVMGPLPAIAAKVSPEPEITEEFSKDGIRFRKILFASEKDDRVPAYLLIPEDISGPVPGILCLHQTIVAGKAEPAGLAGNPNLHYALELARRGYVTLAPDYPNFGDYEYDPYRNGYQSATMKGIWNHMAAVDLLQSLPEVDPGRIGCIGHSLGGHNTLFLAAFDKRIRAAVTSCGFNSFRKYYGGDLSGWSHKGYMPRIATVYDKNPDRMPFDFPEVLAAISPRAVFISAPLHDSNFEVSGVWDCVNAAMPVYELLNASGNIIMINPDAPHDFPDEARQAAYEFLDEKLKNGS